MLFSTADDVHDSLGRLLQELATDADVGLRLSRLDTVVQLRLRQPDTTLTMVAREGDAPAVHLGSAPDGTPNPELVLTLDADVAHRLWLGRQNVVVGVARGLIQTKGETRRIVDLLDLTGAIAPHYEQLLRAQGREDLLDPEAGVAPEPAPGEAVPADGTEGADTSAPSDGAAPDGAPPADQSDATDVPPGGESVEAAIADGEAEPTAPDRDAQPDPEPDA